MLVLPVQGREGLVLEDKSQRQACARVLPSADARPHCKVVHELQEFKVLPIPDDRAQDLAAEAPLHAVPLPWCLIVAVVVEDSPVASLAKQPSHVRGALQGFGHFCTPVEGGPQGALQAHCLQVLERPAPLLFCGLGVLLQELLVRLHDLSVRACGLRAHKIVIGRLQLLTFAAGTHLPKENKQNSGWGPGAYF